MGCSEAKPGLICGIPPGLYNLLDLIAPHAEAAVCNLNSSAYTTETH